MERAPTRSVVCGFDQRVTCTVSCDTEGPKSSCSTHCPKHQEMKSWMDLQHVRFFYIYTYLFDCSASQLQHVGSSIFFKNLQHAGFLVAACEIQFPDQGSNPGPLSWEHIILATGPPGKSLYPFFLDSAYKGCHTFIHSPSRLSSLSVITSSCAHVAAHGIVSVSING